MSSKAIEDGEERPKISVRSKHIIQVQQLTKQDRDKYHKFYPHNMMAFKLVFDKKKVIKGPILSEEQPAGASGQA